MGRAKRHTLLDELVKLPAQLSIPELMAIANLAVIMSDIQVIIPKNNRYLIIHISNGRIIGKEWRHG